jgi:hypothetical protein
MEKGANRLTYTRELPHDPGRSMRQKSRHLLVLLLLLGLYLSDRRQWDRTNDPFIML